MSTTPNGVHALVRRSHEERVLRVLRQHGAQSRNEIAARVGLSRTTVSEITGDLLGRGVIRVVDTDAVARVGSGRPAERLALDPASGQYMGVDFGHRRVNVLVADAAHDIIASGTSRYEESAQWPERLDAGLALIERLSTDTGVHYGALQAIGVGVPGWGDRSRADGVAEVFAERFHAAVIVDNNVRFAGLAEALHAQSDSVRDLIYLRLSDGVGGGLVVGGQLARGSKGYAGELGHVTAVPGGDQCRCGKRGCVETVASVPAILGRCRRLGVPMDSLDELKAAVDIAHPVVDEVLREAGTAVGRMLGTAAMTLNPSEIVLGGDIVEIAPALIRQVRSTVTYELSWLTDAAPVIRPALLSDESGALGAIAALFHESPLLAGYEANVTTDGGRQWP
ncbi:ROK family transcriptional regulator [Nonomuraea roseoviolacea]|uniref:NBD/HSP70 family sugar kinase n=1 Tax=Nonomuraea roseoviolacea subsp. carminata TaxID=160689 RepID=A0ABT1K285_9ACTN|nr:ROK family transcriptional regulator [Nonomuraea roseoviolacea]MCP2348110.1 putative NBD/HSP70 family sugar kinase [Nonomuraea roseoviolacea subsp. carminata]